MEESNVEEECNMSNCIVHDVPGTPCMEYIYICLCSAYALNIIEP